jgi:nitrogen fixation protein NifU and related proteins
MSEEKIYKEELLDHYQHPRNKKQINNPDFSGGQHTPSCGDRIVIEGKIDNGRMVDLGFGGSGCVISQATASMLTEYCMGKTLEEILTLTKDDVLKIIGIELGPTRLKCAVLCLEVLQDGIKEYLSKK